MMLKKMILLLFFCLPTNVVSKLGLSNYNVMYFLFALLLLCMVLSKKKSSSLLLFLLTFCVMIIFRYFYGLSNGSFQLGTILCFPAFFSLIFPENANQNKDCSFYKLVLKCMVACFAVEFVFSYIEFFSHISILGYTNDTYGTSMIQKSRASALFGAPLANSLIISGLLFFILNSNLKNKYKFPIWCSGFLSLMCFQGRIAMIVSFTYLFVYFLSDVKNDVRKNVTMIVMVLGVVFIVLFALYMGVGDRLINVGVFDESSSTVRSMMFEYLLENYKLSDFIWGMSMGSMQYLMANMRVLIIECFFVIHLLFFGLIFMTAFYVQYALLIKNMFCEYSFLFKFVSVVAFVLIAFTSNSLASEYEPLAFFLLFAKFFSPSVFNSVVPKKFLVVKVV